jgi:hypothetical protein
MSKDEYVRPIPFPTDLTPDLEEITTKSDFEAVLLGLGRLMVAFNRLEQQLFDTERQTATSSRGLLCRRS